MKKLTKPPYFSIIIPIYNAEKYLNECLLSLTAQTFDNIEIICINDGSTDNSLNILTKYRKQDQRIIIINKENSGVSDCRNQGIKKSKGKYLLFVDADDYVKNTYCEELYHHLKNKEPELALFSFYNVTGNKEEISSFAKLIHKLALSSTIKKTDLLYMHISIWDKAFNRNFIIQNKIEFPSFTIGEDFIFYILCLKHAEKISILDKELYYYRKDNNISAMHKFDLLLPQLYKAHKFATKLLTTPELRLHLLDRTAQILSFHWQNLPTPNLKQEHAKYLLQINKEFRTYKHKFRGKLKGYKSLKNIINKNRLTLISKIKYFFYNRKISVSEKKSCILGIPIIKVKNTTQQNTKSILFNLIKISKSKNQILYKLFGLKLFKRKIRPHDFHTELQCLKKELLYGVQRSINTAILHQKTFAKYKNCHAGQKIALIGAGPSLKDFIPKKDMIYVGLNSAFLYDKINFDYLFSIDNVGIKPIYEELINYQGNNCKKFFGDQNLQISNQIPESVILKAKASRYKTTAGYTDSKFTLDIESEPLGNFTTVSLQAIQFILYTNPAEIWLVGIDCSEEGHFTDNTEKHIDFHDTNDRAFSARQSIWGWRQLKAFADKYYPETRIYSVNPVGLKGIFTDIYTTNLKD